VVGGPLLFFEVDSASFSTLPPFKEIPSLFPWRKAFLSPSPSPRDIVCPFRGMPVLFFSAAVSSSFPHKLCPFCGPFSSFHLLGLFFFFKYMIEALSSHDLFFRFYLAVTILLFFFSSFYNVRAARFLLHRPFFFCVSVQTTFFSFSAFPSSSEIAVSKPI